MERLIKRVSFYSEGFRSFTQEFDEMLFKESVERVFLILLEFSLFTLTLAKAQKALKKLYY